jgi:hypothetical protein
MVLFEALVVKPNSFRIVKVKTLVALRICCENQIRKKYVEKLQF